MRAEPPPSPLRSLAARVWGNRDLREDAWGGQRDRRLGLTAPYTRFLPLALIVSAVLVALGLWYRGKPLLWGVDASGPLTLSDIGQYMRITDPALGGPDARKLPFLLPIGLLLWLWHLAGVPYSASVLQHLLFFVLLVAGGGTMYWLIRTCLPDVRRVAASCGALFYIFNLYALTVIWTPLSNLIFHYSLLPLVFCVFAKAFERGSLTLGIASGVVWTLTLSPAYVTTPVLITDLLLFGSLLVSHLCYAEGIRRKVRLLHVAAVSLVVWTALNLYWLVPAAYYARAEVERGSLGLDPADLYRLNSAPFDGAVRLAGYWGFTSGYKDTPYFSWADFYTHGLGAYVSFVVPIVVLAGMFWRPSRAGTRGVMRTVAGSRAESVRCRSSRAASASTTRLYLMLFTGIAVVAIVLMTGPYPPLGSFKAWLVGKTGLAGPFRSVYQRFGNYVAFAYAPLLAAGVERWTRKAVGGRGRRLAAGLPFAIGVIVVGVLAWPMWSGATFDRSGIFPASRIRIPSEYHRVASLIDRQRGDFNVLSFPLGSRGLIPLRWQRGNDGYFGAEPLALLSAKPFVTLDASSPYLRQLVGAAAHGGLRSIPSLRLLNTRFIVVHLDADPEYLRGASDWLGTDVHHLTRRLDRTGALRPLLNTPRLRVYEVKPWRPFGVFAVSGYRGRGSIYGLRFDQVRAVRYKREGAGRYSIPAGELRRGDLLVLNHPFDRFWRLHGEGPIRLEPGLTAFALAPRGTFTVEHILERRLREFLLLVPITLVISLTMLGLAFCRGWRAPRRKAG